MERNNVGNVAFIHRRVEGKLKVDCIAVHKRTEDTVFPSKKHLYAKAADLFSQQRRN